MPEPIATWNGARGVWEKTETNILCEQPAPFSQIWPTSGMTLSGRLYPLPTLARHTAENAGSASLTLLGTPRTSPGMDDGMDAVRARVAGGAKLRFTLEEMVALMPTPQSRDWKGAPGAGCQERGGHQSSLPAALLPTPAARDQKGPSGRIGRIRKATGRPYQAIDMDLTEAVMELAGELTVPRPAERTGQDSLF